MNAKQLMIGLGFSMIAAASVPALANDAKTLPGAACQPKSNSPTAFYVSNNGGLYNDSTQELTVICPIVRDVMASQVNGIDYAQVWVIDNNNIAGDPKVSCILESRATNTGIVEQLTYTSVAGASPNAQRLGSYTDLGSTLDGYYYFRCTIPGTQTVGTTVNRSAIVMYRWSEND
jgi:hypothetical protein